MGVSILRIGSTHRNLHRKAYPSGFVGPEYDVAAMCPSDVARDREPQSASSRLAGKQGLENASHYLGRDWTGGVAHLDLYCTIPVR
ncbi:MAG TPA: hypothetical protein VK419_11965, partial [Bryobacteraceae bacterium]|nr:hypothetical protein [Bryobacteraceae bacterium]